MVRAERNLRGPQQLLERTTGELADSGAKRTQTHDVFVVGDPVSETQVLQKGLCLRGWEEQPNSMTLGLI